jgi:cbb3-type cytochrome oxidase maturation protein
MSVIIILILASLTVGMVFLSAFIWSVRSGQYEDTLTPSMRILADEPPTGGARPSSGAGISPLADRSTKPETAADPAAAAAGTAALPMDTTP